MNGPASSMEGLPGARGRPEKPSTLRRDLLFVAVAVVFLWAMLGVGLDVDRLVRLPSRLVDIFGRMFLPPDWSWLGLAMEEMADRVIVIIMVIIGQEAQPMVQLQSLPI